MINKSIVTENEVINSYDSNFDVWRKEYLNTIQRAKSNVKKMSNRWRCGLVVGRRTCDLVVAGSRPGRDAAA